MIAWIVCHFVFASRPVVREGLAFSQLLNLSKISNIYLQSVAVQINVCRRVFLIFLKAEKNGQKNLYYWLLSMLSRVSQKSIFC